MEISCSLRNYYWKY